MKSFLLIISLFICGIVNASNYYFSATLGDDTRTSIQAQNPATPWKTITKLNSFFSSLAAGDAVLFNRGEIFYGAISISKSGTSVSPITIGAYGTGANPIITGLTTISGWTSVGTNLWESSAAVSALATLKMVVINGVNTPMGRYPNVSSTTMSPRAIHTVPGNNGWLNYDTHVGTSQITDNYLPATPNWTGAQAVIKTQNWVIDVARITSHSTHVINYTPTAVDGGTFSEGVDGMSYFIQDDIRTLDEQNEWYYNPSTKKLTIYSLGSPTAVQAATVQNLVNGNAYNYISFSSIDLKGSNADLVTLPNNTAGWSFNGCTISFSGRDGIFTNTSNNCSVQNSIVRDINNNGIMFRDQSNNNSFNNNTVSNIGIYPGMADQSLYFSCEGVHCIGDNVTIQGNNISNIGIDGIRFGGSNVLIKRNFVTNFCMVKTDAGGIYTWGVNGGVTYTNQVIEENTIVNASDLGVIGTWLELEELSANGIYLDGESKNVIVRNNNISHVNASGIYMNTPINCTVRDNTVYDCRYASIHANNNNGSALNLMVRNNICVARGLNTVPTGSNQRTFYYLSISDNITTSLIADSNYYARPMDDATANPISKIVYNGSYTGPGEPGVQTKYTLATWKSTYTAIDQHSKKSPVAITNLSDLRFEYNETAVPKTISLGATYIDMKSVTYTGTITLQPYTSAVLIKTGAGTNINPTANAGIDQSITLPISTVSLSGSGTDPDGTIAAYAWTKISGPVSGTITTSTAATTTVTVLAQGIYKFELKVTDNGGAIATDTMQVTVNAAINLAPTANAGIDQTITLPTSTVSLSGSGTDADGTIASYAWTKISGPISGTITTSTAAVTTVTALAQGIYKFEIKVTDNGGAIARDTMQVTVNAAGNISPTANAGIDQSITSPVSSVSLSGSGTDPDGTIASYTWTKVSGPVSGTITVSTSAATTVTAMTQGVYKFELKVTDNSGAINTDTMQVTENAAINLAPTANAGIDQSITLPISILSLSGSGTDPDGTIASYAWTKISGPTSGTITSSTSAATTVTAMAQGVYKFELKVTDNSGAINTDTMQVTVNAAINLAPTANAGIDQSITLPISILSLSGSGTDPDGTIASYAWTKISGPTSGTITSSTSAATTVTAMAQGVYKFELKVTDNSGAINTDTMQVTVNAAINLAPTANAGIDQSITLPISSVSLSGSGTDPDGTIASYAWTKISGPTSGTITSSTSAATTVTAMAQGVYKFELKVTDNGGAIARDTMQVTVNAAIVNTANNAYGGVRWAIPGTVEAENYDIGGQNVAYYDNTNGNNGGAYRPSEYVDITTSSEGGYLVGWIVQGEWMKYSVNVAIAGIYTIETRIACPTTGKSFRLEMDGVTIATVTAPNTGGSQTWQTVTIPNISLTAGDKIMRIYAVKGGGYNINYIRFTNTTGKGGGQLLNNSGSVAEEEMNTTTVTTFPNPFTSTVKVQIDSKTMGMYQLSLIDMLGKIVWKKAVSKISGSVTETINGGDLRSGTYFLEVISPDQKRTVHKIVK